MFRSIVFVTLVFFAVEATSTSQTKGGVKGVIRELDAKIGTITVKVGTENKTFSLSRLDLPVTDAKGNVLKMADLKVGTPVFLSIPTTEEATAVRVFPKKKGGVILRIDPVARELDLKIAGKATRLSLAKDVQVRFQDPESLDFLKPGMRIMASFVPGKNEVGLVKVNSIKGQKQ